MFECLAEHQLPWAQDKRLILGQLPGLGKWAEHPVEFTFAQVDLGGNTFLEIADLSTEPKVSRAGLIWAL